MSSETCSICGEPEHDQIPLDLAHLPPTYLGPTWQRGENGKFILPEHTLGWEIAGWCSKYLLDPNCDPHDPKPWRFTNEQLRFVLWWYAIDQDGNFIYRQGVLQRLKGWGKDPVLAILCLVELCGPSRFSHWLPDGTPKGAPHPAAWVQVAAVAKDSTKTTMTVFPLVMSELFKADFQVDAGQEIIRAQGGRCRLEAVTSNYRALEGGRVTFAVLGETHHWVEGNGGILMYKTADNNAAKLGNRYLAITNAFLPGEESAAEMMRNAHEDIVEGRAEDFGFLYDSVEAHENTPLTKEGLTWAIPYIRGDSVWVKAENVIPSALRSDMDPQRSRRMYLNQLVTGDDKLVTRAEWDALLVPLHEQLRPGDKIVLGFDGGKSQDATALVAIRVDDGLIQPLCIEEQPYGDAGDGWEVDRLKVDSAVHEAFRLYSVVGFYADVSLWESYLNLWTETYRDRLVAKASDSKPIDWDMRGAKRKVTIANEALLTALLRTKTLKHRGDKDPLTQALRRHVLNACRRENEIGVSFGKESRRSRKKVDGYAALMIAYQALTDYRNKNKGKQRTGRVWAF